MTTAKKATAVKKRSTVKKVTAKRASATLTAGKPIRVGGLRSVSFHNDDGSPAWQPSRRAEFLVDILGNKLVADLLSVAQSQPSRWRRGEEVPGPQVAPVLVDLDHIVGRLLLLWDPSVIGDWLTGYNGFLEGARPIDVLVTRGTAPVLEAIEAEAEGAYA